MLPIPERVRTLAATASVAKLSVDGAPSPARGGVDERGRPVLLVLRGEPLHRQREDAVVAVNLTAMRQLGTVTHPRGLLEVQGWTQAVPREEARAAAVAVAAHSADESLFEALERFGEPGAPRLLRLDVGQVVYLTGQESGLLDADDYLGAAPDPLAETAERVLAHVNASHRQQLAAGVSRQLGERVGEVWLWELDRFGATVRVDESLVRFPWPTPAQSDLCLETALRGLLCTC
ncbi:DUF2470 domain-containing protein [Nonomuraea phyllanthi]|uniref:DUF2470 domain-containing protein n=1 Tax=Nonomuraea phyllanthi TaxID=2219224 RepID=A0A5C4VRY6_9ACTN|nr:DUF2470 domain-containing protein [Nonomuraea phyllanthi]KAB8189725.1 DUF2470 domain-containing protein [Nonomuraea phyllanthi]QFY08681.1 DUF2470 domain-containing protein [Nonomuraea phyllanthi]